MKRMKKIVTTLLSLAMIFSMMGVNTFASDNVNPTGNSTGGMYTHKSYDPETGLITLEAYAEGSTVVTQKEEKVPCDIVLVLDVSGSMSENIQRKGFVEHKNLTVTSNNVGYKWNLDRNTITNYYYKDADGNYYPVKIVADRKGSSSNPYRCWMYYDKVVDGVTQRTYFHRNGNKTTTDLTDYNYDTGNSGVVNYVECGFVSASAQTGGFLGEWTYSDFIMYKGSLYTYETVNTNVSKMTALKESVNEFIDQVNANSEGVEHRISIIKFAGDKKDAIGNDTYRSGGNTYNNTQIINGLTVVNDANAAVLKANFGSVIERGATGADYGMQLAQTVLASARENSNKIVVMFTDGTPTHSSSFQAAVANDTIQASKSLKAGGTSVYTIGVFGSSDNNTNVNNYMNGVSSNYPNASAYNNLGTKAADGYYTTVDNVDNLKEIFKTIATESVTGGSRVQVNASAIVRDIISDNFTLSASNTGDIKVFTAECSGISGDHYSFNDPVPFTNAKVSIDDNKVEVTNFDFAGNWVGFDATNGQNGNYKGKKLIITIPVEAKEGIAGSVVTTNAPGSGIISGGDMVKPFTSPSLEILNKNFVVDYAKDITITAEECGQTTISSIEMTANKGSTTSLELTYGDASLSNNEITYSPKTTNWNGYDSFYSYSKVSADDYFAKINVIPANNVYYEDDFVTNESKGTVGIVYTGDWTSVGTSDGNTETANNAHGGWVNSSLNNDMTYSNGTAHVTTASKENKATASFTFTGTGVDVYSRTDMSTGVILATLANADKSVSKTFMIDNKAKDETRYQIPTLSYMNLPYGTYTLKITVTSANADRCMYYLDGVRVYNPIQEDAVVKEAYSDETNAFFTEIREVLAEGSASYIDEDANGNATTQVYGSSGVGSLAPENEIYLAPGQSVAIAVDPTNNYAIGLKAVNGETVAKVTNGTADTTTTYTIAHTSDLYYDVAPITDADNDVSIIIVKNEGTNNLSITKLKTTGENATNNGIKEATTAQILKAVFDSEEAQAIEYGTVVELPGDEIIVVPSDPSTPSQSGSFLSRLIRGIIKLFGGR